MSLTNGPAFLFSTVIGCPLPEAPYNAYIRGTWETIVIQCNFTNEAWTLTCKDGAWHGEYGNCTSGKYGPRTMNWLCRDAYTDVIVMLL